MDIPNTGKPQLKILETDRLMLRQFTSEDAGFILQLLNEPSFIHFIGDRKIRSLDGAKVYIKNGPVASYAQHGFGLYLVELKETGDSIGMCGLIKRENLDDVDIGYAFLPAFWSNGYAVESALAVRDFARDVVRLKRIVAITDPQNHASIRVLEKIGMTFEKMVKLSQDDIELRLFSINL
jgi:RimJ/RimL family protein N-acetyltransferase